MRLLFNFGWCLLLIIAWTICLELSGNRWGTMSNSLFILFIFSLVLQGAFYWLTINKLFHDAKSVNLAYVLASPFIIFVGVIFAEIIIIGGLISFFGG